MTPNKSSTKDGYILVKVLYDPDRRRLHKTTAEVSNETLHTLQKCTGYLFSG